MFSKFSPPIHKIVLQNHFHVILSDLSLDAPGRPCTPLYAPVSKYYFFKCSQNFHPPLPKSTAKSFSSHFKRFVPGRPCTPLYAPTPLCQNAFCLTSPGAGACHPPHCGISGIRLRRSSSEPLNAARVEAPLTCLGGQFHTFGAWRETSGRG